MLVSSCEFLQITQRVCREKFRVVQSHGRKNNDYAARVVDTDPACCFMTEHETVAQAHQNALLSWKIFQFEKLCRDVCITTQAQAPQPPLTLACKGATGATQNDFWNSRAPKALVLGNWLWALEQTTALFHVVNHEGSQDALNGEKASRAILLIQRHATCRCA